MANEFRGHTPFWFRARAQVGEAQVSEEVVAGGLREITVGVIAFALSDVHTGRRLGHALIAPDARYVSIVWAGTSSPDRRHPGTAEWHLLESALKDRLPATPLQSTHVVARMLLPEERRNDTIVQYVTAGPVTAKSSHAIVSVLDAWVLSLEAR